MFVSALSSTLSDLLTLRLWRHRQSKAAVEAVHDPMFDGLLDEFLAACLVDSDSGVAITSGGRAKGKAEAEAMANAEVLRAGVQAIEMLAPDDEIEDIVMTVGKQLHVLRPLDPKGSMFVYVTLDRKRAGMQTARVTARDLERAFAF